MKRVALTGSIGMGKSETLKMFKKNGIPVFDSDKAVHSLYDVGGEGTRIIEAMFPQAVRDGEVDRSVLSKIVMEDPEALARIEKEIHPLVHKMQQEFIEENGQTALVVMDIPLLFETGRSEEFDKIIVVTAPEDVQRDRVLKRQGMTPEKFEKILSEQMPDPEKRAKADYIIETDKGFAHAETRVADIINELSH